MNIQFYKIRQNKIINNIVNKISTLVGFLCFCSTVYAQTTTGGGSTGGSTVSSGTSVDALQMLINISNSYPQITKLIYAVSYLLGLAFMVRAIYWLKEYGEQRTMMSSQTSLKGPITLFIIASVLLWLPSGLHTFIMTAFGHENVLGYTGSIGGLGTVGTYALIYLVQIIGLISFIRGWVYLAQGAKGGQGQHTTGKALTHIIGGLLAINVVEFTNILWTTFGFTPPFST